MTANGEEVLHGVNYASGAAGIRDDSGQHLVYIYPKIQKPTNNSRLMTIQHVHFLPGFWQGGRFSMNEQLRNHRATVTQIVALLGGQAAAADHLRKCLFTVGIGSNDYIGNYFLPSLYSTSRLYTPQQYAAALIAEYSSQLKVSNTIFHSFLY